MKNKDFKDLLTSINQARKIHSGKNKPTRKKKCAVSRRSEGHCPEEVVIKK